jgi:hypothetical protein
MGDLTPAETMRWFSVNEEYMLEALSLYAEEAIQKKKVSQPRICAAALGNSR